MRPCRLPCVRLVARPSRTSEVSAILPRCCSTASCGSARRRGPRSRVGRAASVRRRAIRARSRAASATRQQRRADCSYPCGWALAASVVAADNSPLLCRAARIEVAAERSAAVLCGGGGWAACAPLLVRSSIGASYDARGGVTSEPMLDAAAAVTHPPRCRSSTPVGRRATRGCATRRIRRRSRRSSR